MVESVLPPLPSSTSYLPRVKFGCDYKASDGFWLLPKVSCKFFDKLAKLKLSFAMDPSLSMADPNLEFRFKNLSLKSDIRTSKTLIEGGFDLGSTLRIQGSHDVKAKKGKVAMVRKLVNSGYNFEVEVSSPYKFELASAFPSFGWPKAKLKSPYGEVGWDERNAVLSLNGFLLRNAPLIGDCTYSFENKSVNLNCELRHLNTTIMPSLSLPSKELTLRFDHGVPPSTFYSYWYYVNSKDVRFAYTHFHGKDYKLYVNYSSKERFVRTKLRLGDERGKVKFTMDVYQDDVTWGRVQFGIRKKWNYDGVAAIPNFERT